MLVLSICVEGVGSALSPEHGITMIRESEAQL